MKSVAIILMNRDLPEQTDRLYAEVAAQGTGLEKKIFVIEAGSAPERRSRHMTHWYEDDPYRGRYFAWNAGLEIAAAERDWDYYWFLANDISFRAEEDALSELVAVMEAEPRLALIGPAEPEADDYEGCFPQPGRRWHKASTVHGLAHLIRGQAIREVGYANPEFHYSQGAGTEMTYRFYREGWSCGYSDRVSLWHQGASTYGNVVPISRHEYLRLAREFACSYFVEKYGENWDEQFSSVLPVDVEINTFPIQREIWERPMTPEYRPPKWRVIGSRIKRALQGKPPFQP